MDEYQRYAVYYLPDPGPLAEFGASWLGWDVLNGESVDHPKLTDETLDVAELTATPRKYGFHGTIKPPFYLSAGHSAIQLFETVETLCSKLPPVQLDGLKLATLGTFLALKPTSDQAILSRLASRVVMELDPFRSPPSSAELTRRRGSSLSPTQEANLSTWGYPYVMNDFRFHMTLTGSIQDKDLRDRTFSALAPLVEPTLTQPFEITSLCLAGADDTGRFQLIERFDLCGS